MTHPGLTLDSVAKPTVLIAEPPGRRARRTDCREGSGFRWSSTKSA